MEETQNFILKMNNENITLKRISENEKEQVYQALFTQIDPENKEKFKLTISMVVSKLTDQQIKTYQIFHAYEGSLNTEKAKNENE